MGYLLEYTLAEGYYRPPPPPPNPFPPLPARPDNQELADRHKGGGWWEERRDEGKEKFRGKSDNSVEAELAGIPQCTAASVALSRQLTLHSGGSAGEQHALLAAHSGSGLMMESRVCYFVRLGRHCAAVSH